MTSNRATFQVWSESLDVAQITARIGRAPDESHDIGDARVQRRTGPATFWRDALWSTSTVEDAGEGHAFESVRTLLDELEPYRERIASLSADCDLVIRWFGDSDSTQGGFVMPHDLMAAVVAFGASVVGDVGLSVDDGAANDDHAFLWLVWTVDRFDESTGDLVAIFSTCALAEAFVLSRAPTMPAHRLQVSVSALDAQHWGDGFDTV